MKKRKLKKEPVAKSSPDLRQEQVERLKEVFPECVTESKVDFDKLRATLGDDVDSGRERYSFSWAGKRDCIRLLQTPSRATLVPCPEESVNFEDTGNLFIEGDNLEVLKLLYRSYFGRVKMIYIDPPYNTGNDFIYPDNFSDPLDTYLKLTGQKDAEGNLLTTNPETSGRYHSTWLSMMYPRLFMARQLLEDNGLIFISIDDNEIHNLRLLMNEIFGEENFHSLVVVQSNKRGQTYKEIAKTHEYLLIYSKGSQSELQELPKTGDKNDLTMEDDIGPYNIRELRNRNPKYGRFNRPNLFYSIFVNRSIKDNEGFSPVSLQSDGTYDFEVIPLNSEGGESCWRWGKALLRTNLNPNTRMSNVVAKQKADGNYGIYEKYRKETYKAKSIWTETEVITEKGTMELRDLKLGDVFDFPKPSGLIKKICKLGCAANDLIMDFTAGSATTAHAVLELNREDGANLRFLLVQLPEPTMREDHATIADIGKERIRRVIARLKEQREGELDLKAREEPEDLGFRVFKLAESNYRPWAGVEDKKPDSYAETLDLFTDPLVDGWEPENVIWEVALKEGYGLDSHIEKLPGIKGNEVYRVTDKEKEQSFRICLDEKLRPAALKALNLGKDDIFVCRDSALDDEKVANLALQCRLKTI